jgi:hypothetical protein
MPVTRFQRANQFAFDPSLGRRADAVDGSESASRSGLRADALDGSVALLMLEDCLRFTLTGELGTDASNVAATGVLGRQRARLGR